MSTTQLELIRAMLAETPIAAPGATLADMRAALDAMGDMAPRLEGIATEPGDAGGVSAEWLIPQGGASDAVLLYLHGGGYALGSVQSHRVLLEHLALGVGRRVLALNYRLAPEAPFPAAIEDVVAAYRWLLRQGVAPGRLAIAGDSAGGGLALAALVALRDAGEPMPACAVAISPWTEMESTGASTQTRAAVDPMVQASVLHEMAKMYLAGADPKSPLASPLHADLRGLPPLLIQVGDAEVLLDDTTRLEPKLKAAGVDATIEVWDEMIHVWHLFAPMLDKGREAIERIGAFVRQHAG
jgi:epsilon-lactone hydrolase